MSLGSGRTNLPNAELAGSLTGPNRLLLLSRAIKIMLKLSNKVIRYRNSLPVKQETQIDEARSPVFPLQISH